jgi:hypothetical protein
LRGRCRSCSSAASRAGSRRGTPPQRRRSCPAGLALQLPFGALAWLAARLLLRAAERLGRALAAAPPRRRPLALPLLPAREPELAPLSPLARALAKRGPPPVLDL